MDNSAPNPGAAPSATPNASATAPVSTPSPSPADTAAPATPETPAERKFKVKVSGEEREVTETELISRYQKEAAAEKKFEEAAKIRKQHDALVKALQTGQGHLVLQKLPPDVRANTIRALLQSGDEHVSQTVKQFVTEQLKFEQMSPEEQENYRIRQENERYKRDSERQAKEAHARRQAETQAKYAQYYQQELPKHLQAAGLPVNAHSMKRMAAYEEYNISHKQNWSLADIAQKVRAEYEAEDQARFSGTQAADLLKKISLKDFTGEQLEALLGEEAANRLREHQVAKLKPNTPVKPRDDHGRFKPAEPPKRKGLEEFRLELEKKRDEWSKK